MALYDALAPRSRSHHRSPWNNDGVRGASAPPLTCPRRRSSPLTVRQSDIGQLAWMSNDEVLFGKDGQLCSVSVTTLGRDATKGDIVKYAVLQGWPDTS